MKIKCLIVDDEPIAQNILKTFVKDTPILSLEAVCSNALEAFEILKEKNIDLIFLDIEMPKLSGIGFLKSLTDAPAVIITTAYRDFALEGYDLNVVDYLLKPFSFERFLKAVNKYNKSLPQESIPIESPEKNFAYFKSERKKVKVNYNEILYFEGLGNYVKIHLEKGKNLVIYHKLTDLEKSLSRKKFLRIHRSFLIAIDKVKAYGTDYVEIGQKQLSVGNTYKEKFSRALR